jgi:hypothetical protein
MPTRATEMLLGADCLLLPSPTGVIPALANAASGILTLQAHLIELNLVIGAVEGAILAAAAGTHYRQPILLMIAANFASACIGAYVLPEASGWIDSIWGDEPPMYHAGRVLALVALLSFLMTVVIEFPFVLRIYRARLMSTGRKLALCVAAQAVTYAALALIYTSVSRFSLLTEVTRVRDVAPLTGGAQGWVYFYRAAHGEIWRTRLDGTNAELWQKAEADYSRTPRAGDLWAEPNAAGAVQLMLGPKANAKPVGVPFRGRLGLLNRETFDEDFQKVPDALFATDFRAQADRARDWIIASSNNTDDGLCHTIRPEGVRGELNVGMATPFVRWPARFPTVLPNGAAVFQFGDQIAIMDRTKNIGVLAMGSSPVVVLDAAAPDETR